MLVSCKDPKRALDIGHVGTFRSDVLATGASTGVIYSRAGFTGPAYRKAKALGLTCCRLYQNQPAGIPAVLFVSSYLCFSTIRLRATGHDEPLPMFWGELLDLSARSGLAEGPAIDLIERAFHSGEQQSIAQRPNQTIVPSDWQTCLQLDMRNDRIDPAIYGKWRRFEGRQEYHCVAGSFCLNDGKFTGSQATPAIDRLEPPGPGWVETEDDPEWAMESLL